MPKSFQEKVKEIKQKVGKTSIYIGRIPEKDKTRFIQAANEEFMGDYGMYLKHLQDFRDGLLEHPNKILSEKIDFLLDEVNKLKEANLKPQEEQGRKLLNGNFLQKRRNENE